MSDEYDALLLKDSPALYQSAATQTISNPFFRDGKISPCGSVILVLGEDRSLSLFDLTEYSRKAIWTPLWIYVPPDSILSYEWFPGATKKNPAYFAFVVAVKDHPIQLLDGSDYSIRASYPIIDHRERFIAPHAMVFSFDGTKLYCGFENAIEIISISSPGSTGVRVKTVATRSSQFGQKGIISALAFSPDGSGLLAAGSFSGSIGFYDTTNGEPFLVDLVHCTDTTGVTKIAFHPASHLLYSASRLSASIEVWNIANLSSPKGKLVRTCGTNQRLGFDINSHFLAVGNDNGTVTIFNAEFDSEFPEAISSFKVGSKNSGVGAVFFHPTSPKIFTCSGSRKFELQGDSSDSEADELQKVKEQKVLDHSLKCWNLF